MKYKLCILVTSGFIFGCSTLKTAEPNKSELAITPSSNHQLVKANTSDEYVSLAKRYIEFKNYEMAIVAYQKALQLEPNNNSLLTGLATTYAKQNLFGVAIPVLEKVASIEPNAKHFNNLGYAYYLNQQYAEANRVLTQAITLEPGYVQAQRNLELVAKNQPSVYLTQDHVSTSTQPIVESNGFVISNDIESSKSAPSNSGAEKINDNAIVPETKSDMKMVQTASSVYVLSLDSQSNSSAKTQAADTVNMQTTNPNVTAEKLKDIFATISGGISFKHEPIINKLFDLASNNIATFNMSNDSKFVEIINGNGVKGIAKAVASKFKESGNMEFKVADAKRFNQMKTHIQYKSGYRDNAVRLNHYLLNKPYLVRNDSLPNDISLRLVLGRDLLPSVNSI